MMAEIPEKVEIDFTISQKTAEGMCRLLTDFLNEHWNMEIQEVMLHGDGEAYRELRLVERS